MILITTLFLLSNKPSAGDYFPLTPGTKWSYQDSGLHGSTFDVEALEPKKLLGNKPYTILKQSINSLVVGELDYRVNDGVLELVGHGDSDTIQPRPVLIIGGKVDWDYYADTISPLSSDVIHILAHSEPGKDQMYFGKMRHTIVLKLEAEAGKKKEIDVNQVAIYAEGVGMVSFSEKGKAGKNVVDHTQTLVSFSPVAEGLK